MQWRIQGPAGGRGGGGQQAPPKIGSTMFFNQLFFIRMLKYKAQIARESIKTTVEFSGPLSGPYSWTLPKMISVPR